MVKLREAMIDEEIEIICEKREDKVDKMISRFRSSQNTNSNLFTKILKNINMKLNSKNRC